MSTPPKFCSNCGEKLESNVDIEECPKCHSALHEHSNHIDSPPRVVEQLPYKSPGTTALIAFLGGIVSLSGIGHMYVGKVRRGIIILAGGFLLFIVSIIIISSLFMPTTQYSIEYEGTSSMWLYMFGYGLIPASIIYFIYFIWQIFDARKFAKKFNESVKTTGKEPW